jgi:hypothetical protein
VAELTIYNTSKSRLETIRFELTDENTTWFDNNINDHDVRTITDVDGGLLITLTGYYYPAWIDNHSRSKIAHDDRSALKLYNFYVEGE